MEFDPDKDALNTAKHGVSLALGERLDTDRAMIRPSDRNGETRFLAYGPIEDVIFAMVFTVRSGRLRPISVRRANRSERSRYRIWAAEQEHGYDDI